MDVGKEPRALFAYGRGIKDPNGTPDWKPVAADDLGRPPYVSIGCIKRNGSVLGTCWLAGANTAVTAAHVLPTDPYSLEVTLQEGGVFRPEETS